MKRTIALILVLGLMAGISFAQSTYLFPYAGKRHIYTAIFDKGDFATRWYVATDPEGTRAPYGTDYTFDELTEGVVYNPQLEALTGTDLMAVSIQWGESIVIGAIYYVFVEVERKGCTNRMALKVVVTEDPTPKNFPPVAQTDHAATWQNEDLIVDVLANDFDPDQNEIYTSEVQSPHSGATVSILNNDSLYYRPAPGFIGPDTIIYRICDTGDPSRCDSDTLFVQVNDHIEARPDYAGLFAGDKTDLLLLPNDTFSAPVRVSVVEDPLHGRYVLGPDGQLSYTADTDYMGNDTLIYRISNPGGSDTALVVFTIKPYVVLKAIAYCQSGQPRLYWETTIRGLSPKTIGLKFYDMNGNLVDEQATAPLSGSIAWPGLFEKSATMPPAELATISLDGEVDGLPEIDIQTIKIDYPYCSENTVTAMADVATIYGVATSLPVLANDFDDDEGDIDPTSVNIYRDQDNNGPYHGTVTVGTDGSLNYIPAIGFNGLDSFIYIVCDNVDPKACDTAMVRLTLWYNQPVFAADDHQTIYTGQTAVVDVLANDVDPDGKIDITSLHLVDDPENGNAIINPDGTISYQPLTGFSGPDSMLYTVCDLGNPQSCDTAWLFVNVIRNQNIMAMRDDVSTFVETPVSFDPLANDFDPEGEIDSTSLIVQLTGRPKQGMATITDGLIIYEPKPRFAGRDSLVYTLCDSGYPKTCDTAIVYFTVSDNNLGIVAMADKAWSINGEAVVIDILSNDFDPDTISHIDTSTVSLVRMPLNGIASVNGNGTLNYTPDTNFYGTDTLIYRVCDNAPIVACDTALVVLVSSTNLPPVAMNDSVKILHGETSHFKILGNDSDPAGNLDSASVRIIAPATGGLLSFDKSTGAFSYKPDECNFGLDSFTYVVSNKYGSESNVATVYINTGVNPNIDLDGDGILDANEDLAQTGDLCDTDTDHDGRPDFLDNDDDDDGIATIDERQDLNFNEVPDYLEWWNSKAVDDAIITGVDIPVFIPILDNDSTTMDPATLRVLDNPVNGYIIVEQADYGISYVPDLDYMGIDSLTYVVCDYYGVCDTAKVSINVEDILIAPELFTPNNDGVNDQYVISGLEKYPQNHFMVYNRWGNKVFEQKNYANTWDGTSNSNIRLGSRALPVGVYYYIVRFANNREKSGGLYLER